MQGGCSHVLVLKYLTCLSVSKHNGTVSECFPSFPPKSQTVPTKLYTVGLMCLLRAISQDIFSLYVHDHEHTTCVTFFVFTNHEFVHLEQ